jgi:hypothetical protein
MSCPFAGRRRAGTGIERRPSGQRRGVPQEALQRPRVHDLATVLPRPRSDVDHEVGGADRLLIVLHDDQRVAEVTQPHEGVYEPAIVPVVQTDGGLVEHVEDTHQPRPDLGRQPDALGLAAGERRRAARQGQIVEPDVKQKAKP